MTQIPASRRLPAGPAQRFDINPNDESFALIANLFARYGDICKLEPLARKVPAYIIHHPDYIKHVLADRNQNYIKGVGFERVKMLLGNGTIVSGGDYWRSQRRMIQPAFHRTVIAQLSATMRALNQRLLARWEAKAAAGEEINVTSDTSELALETVLRAIFSDDLDAITARAGGNPFSILSEDSVRDLKLAFTFRALTRQVMETVRQRREHAHRPVDILSMLIDARDANGKPMPDRALVDEVMTLIVAGHETTASTLNWAWYLLSEHPAAEAGLHAEIDGAFDDTTGFEDLSLLVYTKQIIDETLRLYPPVWLFSRKALAEDDMGGHYVAPGTDIFMAPYFVHRHPQFWDEPEAFKPERFSPEAGRQRHKFVYFPFSMGQRRCIGEFFALIEMQIHLRAVARRLRLRHVPGGPVELEPHINLRSRHNLYMRAELR
ncbi:MAG: cytochrome P450 [Gammaproteobacteria bacterium]